MQPFYLVKALSGAAVSGIATSQTVSSAGTITLNGSTVVGGAAVLDTQRRVVISSQGNDSGTNFTVYGTRQGGNVISETVAGTSAGAAVTTQDFATVTAISTTNSTANTVFVGENTTGSTPWWLVNWHATSPINIGIGVVTSGTVVYSIEYTYDDVTGTYPNPSFTFPQTFILSLLSALSAKADSNMVTPVGAIRLTVLSGTGSATATIIQSSIG